jgi:hypothetical protein
MPKLALVLAASAGEIYSYVEAFLRKTDGVALAKWERQKDDFVKMVSRIKVDRSKKPAAPYAQWCKSIFKCTDPENRMKQQGVEWKKWKEDPANKKELERMKQLFASKMEEYNANKPTQVSIVLKQNKKHQLKDPNAPRKMTSYMFFSAEKRPVLKKKGIAQADMMAELGKLWRNLSETKKEKYNKLAAESKAKYDDSMKSYVRPSDEELVDAKKEKANETKKARSKAKKVEEDEGGETKKARSKAKKKVEEEVKEDEEEDGDEEEEDGEEDEEEDGEEDD